MTCLITEAMRRAVSELLVAKFTTIWTREAESTVERERVSPGK